MSYLLEFQNQIENSDFSKFMQLWEEYCSSDSVEAEEFKDVLKAVKKSDLSKLFGKYVETALPLWRTIQNEEDSYAVLSLLIDIETTNSPVLADIALEALKKKYEQDPRFNERLRLVGLRNKENFQGALSKYDLLDHLQKGKFVFHNGGWGTGEILDVSHIREQIVIDFENVSGKKDLSFDNAFKVLIPLKDDHFLARRFSNPDLLEKEAKESPVTVLRMLLRDLGPKSASEIKDELSELVIPEAEWTRWWQNARTKIKKDTIIESPENLKDPFVLRKAEESHSERLQKAIHNKTNIDEIIQTTYNHIRDLPDVFKSKDVKDSLQQKVEGLLQDPELTQMQRLQTLILLENFFNKQVKDQSVRDIIQKAPNVEELVNQLDIIAFKKRALVVIRETKKDWVDLFLSFLFSVQQSLLRDYILKELYQGDTAPLLIKKIKDLLEKPEQAPEIFVWYFQKVVAGEEVPFSDKAGQCQFFEAFLILLNTLENKPAYKDLVKKMYQMLSAKRYALIRAIIEKTDIDFLKEVMLLASKCQTFADHDMKILRSLAEVVQPSLAPKKRSKVDPHVIWTTEEGYFKTQEKAKHIGTVEIVDVAKEIEAARALGDLRENSEYKFALERRSRLQAELKMLSELLNHARIITTQDISPDEVGVGSIVTVEDSQGVKTTYTILGPWDANADKNVLSFQSKLAQTMLGFKVGEKFQFKDDEFKVVSIKSFLDK